MCEGAVLEKHLSQFSSLASVIVATSELKEEEQHMTSPRGMVATLDEAHTRVEATTLGWGGN